MTATRPMPDAVIGERLPFDGKRPDTGIEQVEAAPALAGFVGGNPRPAKSFLETRLPQVAGRVSREGRWGWDGASLGSASASSVDPIGFAGGDANLHSYVGNAPIRAVDPSGRLKLIVSTPKVAGIAQLAPWVAEFQLDKGETDGYIIQRITADWWRRTCDPAEDKGQTRFRGSSALFDSRYNTGVFETGDPKRNSPSVYFEMWEVENSRILPGARDTLQAPVAGIVDLAAGTARLPLVTVGRTYMKGEVVWIDRNKAKPEELPVLTQWVRLNAPPSGSLLFSKLYPTGWDDSKIVATRSWQIAWIVTPTFVFAPKVGDLPKNDSIAPGNGEWGWTASGSWSLTKPETKPK